MRAVNLIPADARGHGGHEARRTGSAPYAVLGALAMLVALVAVWTVTGRGVGEKRAELTQLQQEATAAQARTGGLSQYGQYAAIRKARVDTVSSLAASRFDWARALDNVSRTLPADAWLTSMTGTVAPGVTVEGGVQGSFRGALPQPAIELVGCTTSQGRLAQLMARLRAVPDVSRVTLADASKAQPGDTSGGGTSDCRGNRSSYPKFSMVLFFGDAATAPATTGAVAAPATAAPTTPAPATPAPATPAPTTDETPK